MALRGQHLCRCCMPGLAHISHAQLDVLVRQQEHWRQRSGSTGARRGGAGMADAVEGPAAATSTGGGCTLRIGSRQKPRCWASTCHHPPSDFTRSSRGRMSALQAIVGEIGVDRSATIPGTKAKTSFSHQLQLVEWQVGERRAGRPCCIPSGSAAEAAARQLAWIQVGLLRPGCRSGWQLSCSAPCPSTV